MYNLKNPTIILFYADWCGYCTDFMPVWNTFKTKINKNKYNIFEIESTDPFIKKINFLQGYPTIYYINNSKVIEYNDGRDLDSLINFINKN
jgi:thiol-disulfide isomerase/thioredoxin